MGGAGTERAMQPDVATPRLMPPPFASPLQEAAKKEKEKAKRARVAGKKEKVGGCQAVGALCRRACL